MREASDNTPILYRILIPQQEPSAQAREAAKEITNSGGSSEGAPSEELSREVFSGEVFRELLEDIWKSGRSPFSLEIQCQKGVSTLCFSCDQDVGILGSKLYASFPSIQIEKAQDLHQIESVQDHWICASQLVQKKGKLLPLQTFVAQKQDAVLSLISLLAELPTDGRYALQLVCRPNNYSFLARLPRSVLNSLRKFSHLGAPRYLWRPGLRKNAGQQIKQKLQHPLFEVSVKLVAMLPKSRYQKTHSREALQELENALMKCNSREFNALVSRSIAQKEIHQSFHTRRLSSANLLSSEELATLWHLPKRTEGLILASASHRKLPAPGAVRLTDGSREESSPKLSVFGYNDFRQTRSLVGLPRDERNKHVWVLGQPGTGKSKLLEMLAKQDIYDGKAVVVIDPHGDLSRSVIYSVPSERAEDVVILDPSDPDYSPNFNPLSNVPQQLRASISSGLVRSFRFIHKGELDGRSEQLLSTIFLTLMEILGGTFAAAPKLLESREYRIKICSFLSSNSLKRFWLEEFEENYETEAQHLLSTFCRLLESTELRTMFCQPLGRISLREIIEQKKILVARLPKGVLGDELSSFVGSVLLTSIQSAVMQQANKLPQEREELYLYVDEFHNFDRQWCKLMLTEGRKYSVCVTVANQYLGQLTLEMQQNLLANSGTILSFRTGAEDAAVLSQHYGDKFLPTDLTNLPVRNFYALVSAEGEKQAVFSGETVEVVCTECQLCESDLELCRSRCCTHRSHASEIVNAWAAAA